MASSPAAETDQAFDILCGELRQELLAQRFTVPLAWKDLSRSAPPEMVADLNISRVPEEKDYVRSLGSNRIFLEFPDGYPYGPGMVFRVTTDLFASIDSAVADKAAQAAQYNSAPSLMNTVILRLDFVRRGNDLKQVVVEFLETQVGESVRRALLAMGYYAYNTAPSQSATTGEGTLVLRDVTFDAEASYGALAGSPGGMKNVLTDSKLNMFSAVFGTGNENAVLPTGEPGIYYLALRKFDFVYTLFHSNLLLKSTASPPPEPTSESATAPSTATTTSANVQRRIWNEFGILVTALKCDEGKVPGRERPLQPWEHRVDVGAEGPSPTVGAAPAGFSLEKDAMMMDKTNAYQAAKNGGYLDSYWKEQDALNAAQRAAEEQSKKKVKKEVDLDDFQFNDEEEEEKDDDLLPDEDAAPALELMGPGPLKQPDTTNGPTATLGESDLYDDDFSDVIQDSFTIAVQAPPPELGISLLPAPTVGGTSGGFAGGGVLGHLPPPRSGLLTSPQPTGGFGSGDNGLTPPKPPAYQRVSTGPGAGGVLSTQLGGAKGAALLPPPPAMGGRGHGAVVLDPAQLAATAKATVKTLPQLQGFLKQHEQSLTRVQESDHQSDILHLLLEDAPEEKKKPTDNKKKTGASGVENALQSNFVSALRTTNPSSGYVLNWINCDTVLKALTANFEKLCILFPAKKFLLPPVLELCMKKIHEPSQSFVFLEKLLENNGRLLFKLLEEHGGAASSAVVLLGGASAKHSFIMNEPDVDNPHILPQQNAFFGCVTLARLIRADDCGGHEVLSVCLDTKLLCPHHLYTEMCRMMSGEVPSGAMIGVRHLKPFLNFITGKNRVLDELLVEKTMVRVAAATSQDAPSLLVNLNADLQLTLVRGLMVGGIQRSELTMKDFADLKSKRPTIFARNPALSQLLTSGPPPLPAGGKGGYAENQQQIVGTKTTQRPGLGDKNDQPDGDRSTKKQRTETTQSSSDPAETYARQLVWNRKWKSLFNDHPESGVPFPPLNTSKSVKIFTFSMSRSTGFYYFHENTKLSSGDKGKHSGDVATQFKHPQNGKQYPVSPQAFFFDQQGAKASKIGSLDKLATVAGVAFPQVLAWSHDQSHRNNDIDAAVLKELKVDYKF